MKAAEARSMRVTAFERLFLREEPKRPDDYTSESRLPASVDDAGL